MEILPRVKSSVKEISLYGAVVLISIYIASIIISGFSLLTPTTYTGWLIIGLKVSLVQTLALSSSFLFYYSISRLGSVLVNSARGTSIEHHTTPQEQLRRLKSGSQWILVYFIFLFVQVVAISVYTIVLDTHIPMMGSGVPLRNVLINFYPTPFTSGLKSGLEYLILSNYTLLISVINSLFLVSGVLRVSTSLSNLSEYDKRLNKALYALFALVVIVYLSLY